MCYIKLPGEEQYEQSGGCEGQSEGMRLVRPHRRPRGPRRRPRYPSMVVAFVVVAFVIALVRVIVFAAGCATMRVGVMGARMRVVVRVNVIGRDRCTVSAAAQVCIFVVSWYLCSQLLIWVVSLCWSLVLL